jgi:phosphotransferase system enzyme I (PtsI)
MHHPAVLRLIQLTVQGAHETGISCNLCGEVPSLEKTLPLLFGLELDGFSLNPSHILPARRVLNNCNYEDCRALAAQVLQTSSTTEVETLLAEWTKRHPLP